MSRYIDAEPFDNMFILEVPKGTAPVDALLKMIRESPTADVQPVVRGEWIPQKGVLHRLEIDGICSECGYVTGFYRFFNHCQNCGARMVEE